MESCIFCKIINGDIASKKVYEDDKAFAFYDIDPQAPVHVLIVPKRHIESMNECDSSVMAHMLDVAKSLANSLNLADDGYRIVVNTGLNGGQTVSHLHFHLLGGRRLGWPPG